MSEEAHRTDPFANFALGVCYYPEHWPRETWAGYARQMRELGLRYVRIGEFAWSAMEPAREQWAWEWLDAAIESLAAEGLSVVLCTPTATPPAWLIREYPEILPVDAQGRRRQFGGRRHYDFASPVYRAESRRITSAIAQRYGEHPAVVGWQTDNEFGCHETARSYTPAAEQGFREWLQLRYDTLGELNRAWGTIFWSQEYADWPEIGLPNLTVAQPNPSHVLDFYRYSSDLVVRFQEEQVAILRAHSPGRWVTHNFMRFFSEFDHFRASECLDFVSWDSYPTGTVYYSGLPDEQRLAFARSGHPDLTGLNHDIYRGLKQGRAFWVMEQQAGQINWAPSNPLPAPGAVALWTAHAWAHGANVVSYFRWRAATMAQELMHSGLLRHDESLDRGGEEVAALDISTWRNGTTQAAVAVLHDYESLWVYNEQPHSEWASYWGQMLLFYRALRALGCDVDVRHPDHDLSGYRVIVAPALQLMDAAHARRLEQAAANAALVVGPRTGYRDESGRVHANGQPGPLGDLLGLKLLNFDGLLPGMSVHCAGHEVITWAESYRPTTGSVSHVYDDGPLAGQAAVVTNGQATTIGAWSPALVQAVLRDVLQQAGVETLDLPEGVRVTRRGAQSVWQNFSGSPVTLPDGRALGAVSFRVD
jgi:beta-galactosidase